MKPEHVNPQTGDRYQERYRNKRNIHYTRFIEHGPDKGCSHDSWMPLLEWFRTIVSLGNEKDLS